MGRSLSTQPAQNSFFLTAGAAIVNEALLEMGSDGKAYPVTDAYGAAVANKGSNVYNETQVSSGYISEQGRTAMVKDSQGNLYVFANTSNYNSITIYKYSPTGTLLNSIGAVALGTQVVYNTYGAQLRILSDGNILALWCDNDTGQKLKFAILSPALAVVKTATNIGNGPYGLSVGLAALSTGGFAVVYDDYSTNTQLKFATFNNAGTAVVAPTTIKTKAAAGAYAWVAELSDGNLVVAYNQSSDHSYGVFTQAGVVVSAFAQLSTYGGGTWSELSVMAGTFCVAMTTTGGAGLSYRVCSNNGTVLGTQTVTSTNATTSWPNHKLMNDGSNYYGVYSNSATSYLAIVTIPAAGTSSTSVDFSSTGYNAFLDAYIEGVNFVWASITNNGTAPYYGVHTLTGLAVTAATALGAGSTTGLRNISILNGSSSTLVGYWSWSSTASCKIIRKKVFNTAIMGVADYAASAGQTVGVVYSSGAYRVNALNLTAPLAFDHLATNIPGNKGTLLPVSAVLKGF